MTKAKGRMAREKGLPEIEGQAVEADQEWSAPPDVVPEEFTIAIDEANHIKVRLAYDGSQLADFCLLHQTRIAASWKDVVRFDCAHGSVHGHYFRSDGSELRQREVRKITSFADIRAGYDAAYKAIISKWDDNLRGF